MKVRLLKDWSYRKAGDVVEVFEPTGQNWILNGIAEPHSESRAVAVEEAVEEQDAVERAVVGRKPIKRQP